VTHFCVADGNRIDLHVKHSIMDTQEKNKRERNAFFKLLIIKDWVEFLRGYTDSFLANSMDTVTECDFSLCRPCSHDLMK
jgi:hypothetical protein